jgi:hypothetical protein
VAVLIFGLIFMGSAAVYFVGIFGRIGFIDVNIEYSLMVIFGAIAFVSQVCCFSAMFIWAKKEKKEKKNKD